MNYLRIGIVGFFLLSPAMTGLRAQQAIASSGGTTAGTGGTVSYSVGQVLFSTLGGTGGTVAQGVQQPWEISVVSGTEARDISLVCSVFPNPVSDRLVLKTEGDMKDANVCLYDSGGKFLEGLKIRTGETTIDMSRRVASVYFLKVIRNNREVKTYKIIRN